MAAAVGQLAGRHGDEEALGPLDDLEITDDEHVVERDAAEGLQPLVAARVVFHELDANFGDFHSQYSFTWRSLSCSRVAGDDPDSSQSERCKASRGVLRRVAVAGQAEIGRAAPAHQVPVQVTGRDRPGRPSTVAAGTVPGVSETGWSRLNRLRPQGRAGRRLPRASKIPPISRGRAGRDHVSDRRPRSRPRPLDRPGRSGAARAKPRASTRFRPDPGRSPQGPCRKKATSLPIARGNLRRGRIRGRPEVPEPVEPFERRRRVRRASGQPGLGGDGLA